MDALRHVHTLLKPGGELIDSRPLGDGSAVAAGGRSLGRLDEREFSRELELLDAHVAALVRGGLFEARDKRLFDVDMQFDTAAELLSEVVTWRGTVVPVRLQRAVKAAEPPFRVRLSLGLAIYSASSTGSPTRTRPASTTPP